MRDLRNETLSGMLKGGAPPDEELPEGQRATAEAVRAIAAGDVAGNPRMQRGHQEIVEQHALCYRKWGLAYVQDAAAWLLFCRARDACGDSGQAVAACSLILPQIDWALLEDLFRENWEVHRAGLRRRGTDKSLASDLAKLHWALGDKGIPGVRGPGDLHRIMSDRGPSN